MALRLGDPTAKEMGRITLNPIPHIDPIGSIVVPLICLLAPGGFFIAWAKPVPVNPLNFRNYRRDEILVSAVGPFSNLVLAFFCALCSVILLSGASLLPASLPPFAFDAYNFLVAMFYSGVAINIVLAVFNLLPIPPLDGSHVVASLLPDHISEQYRQIGFFGIFLLLLLMQTAAFRAFFGAIVSTIAIPFQYFIHTFV